MNITKHIALLLGVLAALAHVSLAHAEAGIVLFSSGEAYVRAGSGDRIASIGGKIESGDALVTREGRLQIRFTDGAMVSMQPYSEFRVDDYEYQQKGGGPGKSFLSLVKGGLRVITGLIGRKDRAAYRMDTVVATIGIRGTEYLATLKDEGLYVHTGEGTIFLKNAGGEIDVSRGQTGFVKSQKDKPILVSETPVLTAKALDVNDRLLDVPGIGWGTEFQAGTLVTANPFNVVPLSSAGIAAGVSGTMIFNDRLYQMHSADSGATDSTDFFSTGGVAGAYMDGTAFKGLILSRDGSFGSVVVNDVSDAGTDGVLYWGRWTDTKINAFLGLSGVLSSGKGRIMPDGNVHYIIATSIPTIPGSGTATYSFVGGTPSTDVAGGKGAGITSGTLVADFLSAFVGASFKVSHGSTYNVDAFMPLASTGGGSFSSKTGGFVQVDGLFSPSAQVAGFFAGKNAPTAPSHAGISYQIPTGPGATPTVGVGGFACKTGC